MRSGAGGAKERDTAHGTSESELPKVTGWL